MNRIESLQQIYADYPDPIVVETTILKFKALDPTGKIQLLEKLHQSSWGVPDELRQVASRDDNAVVRLWVASHWHYFDFKGDPDDLVRATVVAHGEFRTDTESEREEKFKDLPPDHFRRQLTYFHWDTATVRERLVFLRRDDFGYLADLHVKPLILKLFDPTNELVSDLDERKQYVLAFLKSRAGRLHKAGPTSSWFGEELIELMPLWPYETGIQDFVYRFCALSQARLDAVYQYCSEPLWRWYLLENLFGRFESYSWWRPGDHTDRMLELARQDPDDDCRELAYRDPYLAAPRHISTLRRAVRSSDLPTLRGLAKNRGLSRRQLRRF
jgi:hypothetical protein